MRKLTRALIGDYHLGQVLREHAEVLGQRCGLPAVTILTERLKTVLGAPEDDQYSYAWRRAIESHEQNARRQELRDILVDGVRDALLGSIESFPRESESLVADMLASQYRTVERIGIFVCGERYAKLGALFWQHFRPNWLDDAAYWHELYWFLKKSFPHFSKLQRDRLLQLVRDFRGAWEDESRAANLDEQRRRDLLHAVHGQGDDEVDGLYQQLTAHIGLPREHIDFRSYMTHAGVVSEASPITADCLLQMPPDELIAYLREFQPSKEWRGPSIEGLAETVSEAVRLRPEALVPHLGRFIDLPRAYQYGLLRGLEQLWKKDKEIPWPEIIAFVNALSAKEQFAQELEQDIDAGACPTARWVAHVIADLIRAGVERDEHAFAPELLDDALSVVRRLLSLARPEAEGKESDAVTEVINSNRGRILETLLDIGLRRCRLADKAHGSHASAWADVGPVLEQELTLSESGGSFEFATLAGLHLPHLHYMNPEWVRRNFDRVFPRDKPLVWGCAAQGFSYASHYFPWLYKELRDGGHLRQMVFSDGLPEQVREKALQYVALAYLDGTETLKGPDGLLWDTIQELRKSALEHLSWFFWTLRGEELSDEARAKVVHFWREVSNRIRGFEAENGHLLSSLSTLADLIPSLTPAHEELWAQAAPYADVAHHGYVLVENLARFADAYPDAVVRIFRAALEGFLPDFDNRHIVACIRKLFEAGRTDDAEEICNIYARRGSDMLREIYEEFRSRSST